MLLNASDFHMWITDIARLADSELRWMRLSLFKEVSYRSAKFSPYKEIFKEMQLLKKL